MNCTTMCTLLFNYFLLLTSSNDSSDQTVHVDLTNVLNDSVHEYELPRHQRGAAHTLNLVSTTDADKAEADTTCMRISGSASGNFRHCRINMTEVIMQLKWSRKGHT